MGELRIDYGHSRAMMREISDTIDLLYEEKSEVQGAINEISNLSKYYSKTEQAIGELSELREAIASDIDKLEIFTGRMKSFLDKVQEVDSALGEKFKTQVSEYCKMNSIEETTWYGKALDVVQFTLDVIGFIPGLGEIADFINGLISLARGDYFGALLSFLAMIPLAGDAFKSLKYLDEAGDLLKYGDEVVSMGKAFFKDSLGQASKWAKKTFVNMNPNNIKNVIKESIDLGKGSFYVKLKNGIDFAVDRGKDGLSNIFCDKLKLFCFASNTLVETKDGFREIKDIKIKDLVLSQNIDTGALEYKEVTELHIGSTFEKCIITLDNTKIETTTGHLFMTKDRWWQSAVNLKENEEILDANGSYKKVAKVETILKEYPEKVYNLTVEDNSNYFVSEARVLAHNKEGVLCSVNRGVGNASKTIWDNIKITQPMYDGTKIPKSFELTTSGEKFWVHPNGTKHMVEYITRDPMSHGMPINTQTLLSSFQNSVSGAVKQGVKYDEIMNVGNWELIFSKPRGDVLLPVIKHAVYRP